MADGRHGHYPYTKKAVVMQYTERSTQSSKQASQVQDKGSSCEYEAELAIKPARVAHLHFLNHVFAYCTE